ncbi:MAG: carboxylate-amine ligase [Gemmatimonadales bacterium]|nr:carboxylate-amine ligase [Gemmatimonadales bacterium]
MTERAEPYTIGVEEEYQIVDAESRELRPQGQELLPAARSTGGEEVQPELYLSQIEIATPVCRSLAEARSELVRLRRSVIDAAAQENSLILAAGTHPFSHWEDQQITPKERYRATTLRYQQLARELVICGCHVHVGVPDKVAGLEVMNRARLWLAPILALASNSPYWLGADTGYASFRTQLWNRFPISGPPGTFCSAEDYRALVDALVATDSIGDESRIYWDMRLPAHLDTVEFRVTDVCLTVDEAVMVAGLARALTRSCLEAAQRGDECPMVRPELLRAAHWRAARYGIDRDLIHLGEMRALPAREMIGRLLEHLRPALEAADEWDEISGLVGQVLERGTGASRQREAFRRAGSLEDVVDFIAAETSEAVRVAR